MKKVFGYIFLVIGSFVGVSLIMQLPSNIEKFTNDSKTYSGNGDAYLAGAITGIFIMALIAFLLIWFGLKWIKKVDTEQSNLPK